MDFVQHRRGDDRCSKRSRNTQPESAGRNDADAYDHRRLRRPYGQHDSDRGYVHTVMSAAHLRCRITGERIMFRGRLIRSFGAVQVLVALLGGGALLVGWLSGAAQAGATAPSISGITFAPASINSGGTSAMTIAFGNL